MTDNFFKNQKSKFHNSKLLFKKQRDATENISDKNSSSFFVKSKKPAASGRPKTLELEESKPDKKPFDKKRYRFQKYSNKYKLQQWEEQRKKAVLRKYHKSLKKDERSQNQGKKVNTNQVGSSDENKYADGEKESVEGDSELIENISENSKEKTSKFHKAYHQFQSIKEEKEKARELFLKKKIDKEEAMRAYKKKKFQAFKKINKKTKKGQPVMKGRIEMLLEKIQNSIK